MKVYSIYDKEFENYGKAVDCPFFDVFEKAAKDIPIFS